MKEKYFLEALSGAEIHYDYDDEHVWAIIEGPDFELHYVTTFSESQPVPYGGEFILDADCALTNEDGEPITADSISDKINDVTGIADKAIFPRGTLPGMARARLLS